MRFSRINLSIAAVFLATVIGAQDAIDLKSALQRAESGNLELRAARQQRALALAGISTARQFPNPTLSFAAARDLPHESVIFDQPLEIAGQRGKRIAVAREEQRATELNIAGLARQVRRRTREAFFRSLILRTQSAQAQAALDIATRVKGVVQQRYDAGDVAQLEVLQADVELARADAEHQFAAQTQRAADALLAALLNLKFDASLSLNGAANEFPPPPQIEQLLATALQANADIARSTQDLRTEEHRLTLAKAQRVPNLDLQAGTDLNAPPDFKVGPRGQIGIQLPIFYHGQGEVALVNARIELLRLTLESQRVNVNAQVAAAYYDFTAKLHQTEQFQDRIVPERVKLEAMAEDSYRSGKSNLLTLIDAQRKLNDVQRAYLDSLLAAQSAFATLEETVGAPLD